MAAPLPFLPGAPRAPFPPDPVARHVEDLSRLELIDLVYRQRRVYAHGLGSFATFADMVNQPDLASAVRAYGRFYTEPAPAFGSTPPIARQILAPAAAAGDAPDLTKGHYVAPPRPTHETPASDDTIDLVAMYFLGQLLKAHPRPMRGHDLRRTLPQGFGHLTMRAIDKLIASGRVVTSKPYKAATEGIRYGFTQAGHAFVTSGGFHAPSRHTLDR